MLAKSFEYNFYTTKKNQACGVYGICKGKKGASEYIMITNATFKKKDIKGCKTFEYVKHMKHISDWRIKLKQYL